jgi:hypothetical protein
MTGDRPRAATPAGTRRTLRQGTPEDTRAAGTRGGPPAVAIPQGTRATGIPEVIQADARGRWLTAM